MENNDKALRAGTVLHGASEYHIVKVLGAGGFGITYLATAKLRFGNLPVDVRVAIKEHFMSDHCERGGDAATVVCPGTEKNRTLVADSLKDFIGEARRLKEYGAGHSNIVKVNEIFEANGTAYYVMEYIDGQSMADYIAAKGSLDENGIRALVVPVVDAVSFLHKHQLTHLDIKPGNIMLSANEDGSVRPVLIDFGLSKHYNSDGSATSTVNITAVSDGFSPVEQYSGIRTFSPTADVYALGATMYSAATGTIPTVSTEWPSGEPDAGISTLPLSGQLRAAIARAMSSNKNDRYPDAGALLAALNGCSEPSYTVQIPKFESKPELPRSERETQIKQAPTPRLRPHSKPRNRFKPLIYCVCVIALVVAAVIAIGNNSGKVEESVDLVTDSSYVAENQSAVMPIAETAETIHPPYGTTDAAADRQRQEQEDVQCEREEPESHGQMQEEQSEQAEAERQYRTPHNLDLAVQRNGETYYFNQLNWSDLISGEDYKLGVVVIRNDQRFIISLTCMERMKWRDVARYSNVMPTLVQARAIASQHQEVNAAIRAYGGNVPDEYDLFWTRTEHDHSNMWIVNMSNGDIFYDYKSRAYRTRLVTRVLQ